MINLYPLDLLGVLSFAFFGSYIGLKKRFDLFGIFVCAVLSGLGGGTIREMILHKTPVYLTDYNYLLSVILGMILGVALYNHFPKLQKYYLIVDAIGLSTFAFIGAQTAAELHLSDVAIVFFATITAVGGGILRDIAIRETPSVFHKDFYATPAILLGIVYAIGKPFMQNYITDYLLIFFIFILRILAIQYEFRLWSKK